MKPFQTLRPLVQLVPAAAVAAAVFLTLPHTEPVLAAVPERLTPPVETAREAAVEEAPEEEVLPRLPYPDGVYTGSARGYGGPVKVQVTMENGTITGVEILNASHETAAFLKRARRLLNTVVTAQTWEVDAVSEATYTSRGILGRRVYRLGSRLWRAHHRTGDRPERRHHRHRHREPRRRDNLLLLPCPQSGV